VTEMHLRLGGTFDSSRTPYVVHFKRIP